MWKWILGGLGALAVVLIGVIVVRTQTFKPAAAPAPVELATAPQIDAQTAADHLAAAIRIQTISRTPGVVEDPAAFEALHAFLQQTYPRTHAAMTREFVDGYSLVYTLRGSDPALQPLVLLAHQDVVPVEVGTEGDWDAPPFAGEIKDGFVIGRGAVDDKGSLIAIFEGMEALLAQGFAPRRTIIFAFGHDEETKGAGAVAMAALMKERNQRAWFVLDEGMAIIEDFPLTGGAVALIGIAEKGYLTVRVTARGEGGHSSRPPRDTTAERLSRAILALRARPFPGSLSDGPAPLLLDAVAPELPWMTRMAIANRWAFSGVIVDQFAADPSSEALLRTTIAPTIVSGGTKENVLPQTMTATVNLRLHPRDSIESAVAYLRESVADIEGITIEVDGEANEPSAVSQTASDSYALIASAARAAAPANTPVAPMLVLGATDSRHYADVTDNTYRFSATLASVSDTARVHGTGERISVENMGRMSRFYAQVLATGAR